MWNFIASIIYELLIQLIDEKINLLLERNYAYTTHSAQDIRLFSSLSNNIASYLLMVDSNVIIIVLKPTAQTK